MTQQFDSLRTESGWSIAIGPVAAWQITDPSIPAGAVLRCVMDDPQPANSNTPAPPWGW